MAQTERIGILTSGGDAPGMNAAIRSVVRVAIEEGYEVIGFLRGYNGLIEDDYVELTVRSVSDIIHRGGTIIYTARCDEFRTVEGRQKAAEVCRKHNLKGLVVIGGDGTFTGALALTREHGINCVGIPATIDNDIGATDYSIGFDTAVNTAAEMVDKIRDTSQSHDRCTVVEVMGRHAGYIALDTGMATGATAILIPEIPFDFETDVIGRIRETMANGKKHFIIMVAEGVGGVGDMAKEIGKRLNIEARASVLGYVQRGGSPTAKDRVIASLMGYRAIDLLNNNIKSRVVIYKNDRVLDADIEEALATKKSISIDTYDFSKQINS